MKKILFTSYFSFRKNNHVVQMQLSIKIMNHFALVTLETPKGPQISVYIKEKAFVDLVLLKG